MMTEKSTAPRYLLALRNLVEAGTIPPIVLHLCYAVSGTEAAYCTTRCRRGVPPLGRRQGQVTCAICLRAGYAVSGTDIAYAGQLCRSVRAHHHPQVRVLAGPNPIHATATPCQTVPDQMACLYLISWSIALWFRHTCAVLTRRMRAARPTCKEVRRVSPQALAPRPARITSHALAPSPPPSLSFALPRDLLSASLASSSLSPALPCPPHPFQALHHVSRAGPAAVPSCPNPLFPVSDLTAPI
eukprot:1339062-Rhodomonas_salina.1